MSAVSLILAVGLGAWYAHLWKQSDALSIEVWQLGQEWANVSANSDEARKVQPRFQTFIDGARRVSEEHNSDQWTPILRSLAVATEKGIDLRGIRLLKTADEPQALVLRLEGVSIGAAPRTIADQFFQRLRRELGAHFRGATECRFERLDDEPDSAPANPDQQRATFTITVPVGATAAQPAARTLKN